jgi:hypothetical protein
VRVIARLLLCLPCLLLLGLTCPSPEPFPPPPPAAPLFSTIEVAAFKFDTYRPAVHLHWQMPANDSLAIHEFVILQKTPDDSDYSVLVRSIPDSVFDFYEALDNITLPGIFSYKTVLFRMYAVDMLGRTGDTAATDSIVLLWPPQLLVDTLRGDSLAWSVSSVQAGFFTTMYLYSDSIGLVWKNPRPDTPSFLTDGQTMIFTQKIPSSLLPLSAGVYYWAAKIEAPALNAQSIALRRLYAH